MDLAQIVNDTTPYLNSAAFGAVSGVAGHLAVSGLRALGPGSTLVEELKDTRNMIFGVGVAWATGFCGHDYAQNLTSVNPQLLKYTGAAVVGGVAGMVGYPVASALTSKEGIASSVSVKTRNGFIAGAVFMPIAYLAADLISRYF